MPRLVAICAVAAAFCFAAAADYLECPELPSGVQLRPENRYFDVVPRVVRADQETTVEIVPKFAHVQFRDDCKYELTYVPTGQRAVRSGWANEKNEPVTPADGKLLVTRYFEGEQEHVIFIEEIKPDNKRRTMGEFRVYSLEDDLFALRPYKGDFHMHSNNSDGVETPEYVAGACRRAGLDFMALTDHRNWPPSVQAAAFYENLPVDLRIYPGEEIHPPGSPVHHLAFGANASITDLWKDEAAWRAEVQEFQKTLGDIPEGVDPFTYATSVWTFNKIREHGGLGMLCHPYWFTNRRFGVPAALLDHLFETQPFDVLELVSGFGSKSLDAMDVNGYQIARYNEERAKGKKIPVAGISDTHGVEHMETFGRYYTVCFAPSSELKDLQEAIMDLRSVAVEAIAGERPRPYGPFRLVSFTHFLLREVFPQHDELCFEEGRLMIAHSAGEAKAVESLKLLQGQTAALYDQYWAD